MKTQGLGVAALLSLACCSPSDNGNNSEPTVKKIAAVPATEAFKEGWDITKFFGAEKPFCDYANNVDILTPNNTKRAPIKTKQDFWESSLAQFDGSLHGLKVVGVASFRLEGVGANAIIFNENSEKLLEVLGKIYGKSNALAQYFPASIEPERSVACPDCEAGGDHPQFTAIRDAAYSKEFYGFGMSSIECGFFD